MEGSQVALSEPQHLLQKLHLELHQKNLTGAGRNIGQYYQDEGNSDTEKPLLQTEQKSKCDFQDKQWGKVFFCFKKDSSSKHLWRKRRHWKSTKSLAFSGFPALCREVLLWPRQGQQPKILLQKFRLEQCYRCTTLISSLGLSKPCFE